MSVQVGLRDIYYALLTTDPAGGTPTYAQPVRIVGAMSANINPNSSSETLFADDGPYEIASTIGQISLELNVVDLPLDTQAVLLGHTYSGGLLIRKSTDVPPWLAIGFKTLKSNGHYRFTWLAKGKFSAPEQSNETRGDAINFQTPTITGSFVKRDSDSEWERHADEDDADYVTSIGTNWFTSPLGTTDLTALTATIVPLDAATAVAVSANVVWTFNKELQLSTVTTSNFMVIPDGGGSAVAGALSIDATHKIVTFNPTSNLTALTAYDTLVTTSVKDIYGVSMTAPMATTFTTA